MTASNNKFSNFSATVTNLQNKVESLTTTNALMKEDLAIAKNSLLTLYEENQQLKRELGRGDNKERMEGVRITNISDSESESKAANVETIELRQRLEEERKLRQEADKELELQVNVLYFWFYGITLNLVSQTTSWHGEKN